MLNNILKALFSLCILLVIEKNSAFKSTCCPLSGTTMVGCIPGFR